VSADPPRRPRPRRRRVHRGRLLIGIVLLVVVFLLGIAFGQALHDNPTPGENTTFVRTFFPLAPKATVTVTSPSG